MTLHYNTKVLSRFWAKVKKTSGCWLWIAAVNPNGYGLFWLDGSFQKAHRASWKIHIGEIPGKLLVCHHCDVPACVRPDHLWLGTQADNMKDCARKGRTVPSGVKGERVGTAKLTEKDIKAIRQIYATGGKTQQSVAKLFDTTHSNVSLITNRKSWKHIP